jgi:GH15 family glucan-1,4-alpha-glucosidase
MSRHPIADYALLSDRHGAALVRRDGSVDWLCLPRFDAPAQFARLLDEDAGYFAVTARDIHAIDRRYLPQSLVLETTFSCAAGTAVLRDALATGVDEQVSTLGFGAPHLLLREVTCTEGEVEIDVDFQPRPEYGLIRPLLEPVEGGLLSRGGASMLRLSADLDWAATACSAAARARLGEGERLCLALQHSAIGEGPSPRLGAPAVIEGIELTLAAWQAWSNVHQTYDGPWTELVLHSGRVLQGLGYQPTGAVVAAPTTSLATCVGGSRNWDYRYSWVRDASLTLDALWVAACPQEAHRFFDFLGATALIQVREQGDLQCVFGIQGEHDLAERELPWLSGWRDSRPVRIGNGAWSQRQLDGYGDVLLAAHRLREQLGELSAAGRRFLAEIADAAAARWHEPDQGIWEMRTEPRHYLHSKVMCWAGLDRAIRLAKLILPEDEREARVAQWREAREAVRDAIQTRGFSERLGAFTQAFDTETLDAAVLTLPLVGFLPADDPRVLGTMDAIEEQLTDGRGFVYRYRADDGLPGGEGPFLLCTFWLAQARAMAGQVERAVELFELGAGCANDLGLLAEQIDSDTGELLGNFPQAFSHIGLANAAQAIAEAQARGGRYD